MLCLLHSYSETLDFCILRYLQSARANDYAVLCQTLGPEPCLESFASTRIRRPDVPRHGILVDVPGLLAALVFQGSISSRMQQRCAHLAARAARGVLVATGHT